MSEPIRLTVGAHDAPQPKRARWWRHLIPSRAFRIGMGSVLDIVLTSTADACAVTTGSDAGALVEPARDEHGRVTAAVTTRLPADHPT